MVNGWKGHLLKNYKVIDEKIRKQERQLGNPTAAYNIFVFVYIGISK